MFMSDDDNEYPRIRNEDTLRRRAWIDRALAGVRERLKPDEIGEQPALAQPAVPVSPVVSVEPVGGAAGGRRRLYVIRSRDNC